MKGKSNTVRCMYSDTGRPLEELIRESFRIYLQRELWGQTACRDLGQTGHAGSDPEPGGSLCPGK